MNTTFETPPVASVAVDAPKEYVSSDCVAVDRDKLESADSGIVLFEKADDDSWPGSVASETEFERADNGTWPLDAMTLPADTMLDAVSVA